MLTYADVCFRMLTYADVGGALDLDVEDGYKPTEVHSNTTFADVVGVDEAKKELQV
jgi:hypothetical protein